MDLDAGLRERTTKAAVARLATVRPTGEPHVVPITFALDDDTVVTVVDHKPKTTTDLQRLRNIAAHPAASLLIDHYEDDWTRLWWVRGDGSARVVNDGPTWDRAVALITAKYPPYQQVAPDGPVIVLTVERWTWWSA